MLFLIQQGVAQNTPQTFDTTLYKGVLFGEVAIGIGGTLLLNEAWYDEYDRGSFHFFNDLDQWNQVDKVGHLFSGYQLARGNFQLFESIAPDYKKNLVVSVIASQVYLAGIEVLDGFSEGWGFSPWDMGANLTGAGMFALQELAWKEQRFTVTFSFHQTRFASMRPELLGHNLAEQVLKDYNGHSYWLNINPSMFFSTSGIPPWLDISFGYGATGMVGGDYNPPPWCSGASYCPDPITRSRVYFLSPGLRLNRIKTNSKLLKALFSISNVIRLPLPAVSLSNGSLTFHPIYF